MRSFFPILTGALALLQNACSTTSHHQAKKTAAKEPERYEAPFEQTYSNPHQNTLPRVKTLTAENNATPQIIEPELADPNEPEVLEAIAVKGKPHMVLSPYILSSPNRSKLSGLIDTSDFPPGSKVRDPYTGKVMRIPLYVEPDNNKGENKAESKLQKSDPSNLPEAGGLPTESQPKNN